MIPITIWRKPKGANARNWPGVTMVDPDHPRRAAIWAQEAWESTWKMNPLNLIDRLLSKAARREMEIMGHEVEVQAAKLVYGDAAGPYRLKEAMSLEKNYGGLFKGRDVMAIQLAMLKCQPEARAWVLENLDRIKAKQ